MASDSGVSSATPTRTAVTPAAQGGAADTFGLPPTEARPSEPFVGEPIPDPPPPSIGPYAILRAQARGGLGEVFLAQDAALGRQVAL